MPLCFQLSFYSNEISLYEHETSENVLKIKTAEKFKLEVQSRFIPEK